MTITKEGALASFYTVNKAPIKHLKVYFSPKQAGEGTPSPSNIRTINGWTELNVTRCGKNLFSLWNNGYWNAGITKKWDDSSKGAVCKPIHVNSGTTFTISQTNISATYQFHEWDKYVFSTNNYTGDDNLVFAMSSNGQGRTYIAQNDSFLTAFVNIGTDTITTRKVQLELGSMATSYEPYSGTTIPVDWSAVAGTLYGGYVDLVTGELVENYRKIILDGSSDESWWEYSTYEQYKGFALNNSGLKPGQRQNGYANWMPVVSNLTSYNLECWLGVNNNTVIYCASTASLLDTYSLTAWRSYLSEHPLEIVIPLDTPITHTLFPTQLQTLIGRNNIWSNADRVEVEYDLAESNDELYRRRNILMRSAPHIETASGNIAHFETDIAAPIKSAIVSFSPVQEGEGDPSPTNVRNISGWNGITIGNQSFNPGPYTAYTENNGTYCDIKAGQTFKFEGTSEGLVLLNIYRKDESGIDSLRPMKNTNGIQWDTRTAAEDIARFIFVNSQVTNGYVYMLNNTTEIDWQTAAGTIYGGYVDLVTGEVVQEWDILDLGTVQWNRYSNPNNDIRDIFIMKTSYPSMLLDDSRPLVLCNKYQTARANIGTFGDKTLSDRYQTKLRTVMIKDSDYYEWDPADFKTAMSGTIIAFPLETPIHYPLSTTTLKTLHGTNNIWSNANGPVEIKYWTH